MPSKQIKCPNCDEWVVLQQSFSTNCAICGTEVIDQIEERKKLLHQNREKQLDQWIFKINPYDGIFLRFLKSAGNFIYLVMMAIAGFIAWLVAVLPG